MRGRTPAPPPLRAKACTALPPRYPFVMTGFLHMFCGLPAAGKSTLAARIAEESAAVRFSEDVLLKARYGDQMQSLADYARCAAELRADLAPDIIALLKADMTVVLDFPANTPLVRDWMRGLIEASGADHRLHVLELPDAALLARLTARAEQGDHPFQITEAQFARIKEHVSLPGPDEGFTLIHHTPSEAL